MAAQVKRRREIWEALNPVNAQRFKSVWDALGDDVSSGATCAETQDRVSSRGRICEGRPPEFASETAAVTGESKSQINRHLARAEALGDDLDKVTGTSALSRDSCFAPTEAPAVGLFFCLVLGGYTMGNRDTFKNDGTFDGTFLN